MSGSGSHKQQNPSPFPQSPSHTSGCTLCKDGEQLKTLSSTPHLYAHHTPMDVLCVELVSCSNTVINITTHPSPPHTNGCTLCRAGVTLQHCHQHHYTSIPTTHQGTYSVESWCHALILSSTSLHPHPHHTPMDVLCRKLVLGSDCSPLSPTPLPPSPHPQPSCIPVDVLCVELVLCSNTVTTIITTPSPPHTSGCTL